MTHIRSKLLALNTMLAAVAQLPSMLSASSSSSSNSISKSESVLPEIDFPTVALSAAHAARIHANQMQLEIAFRLEAQSFSPFPAPELYLMDN